MTSASAATFHRMFTNSDGRGRDSGDYRRDGGGSRDRDRDRGRSGSRDADRGRYHSRNREYDRGRESDRGRSRGTSDRGRSRSRSRSRDRIDYEARDRADALALRGYTASLSPRQPSSLLAMIQLPGHVDPSCSTTARCAPCSIISQVRHPCLRASSMVGPHARGRVATWQAEK